MIKFAIAILAAGVKSQTGVCDSYYYQECSGMNRAPDCCKTCGLCGWWYYDPDNETADDATWVTCTQFNLWQECKDAPSVCDE